VTIPGPSALAAAVSLAGLVSKEFTFLAFPPHKKGRKTFFEDVAKIAETRPVVFYESTHRILKALESLVAVCPARRVMVAKELTKMFEETVVGTPAEIIAFFTAHPDKVRGEFVVVVE
jgi:16S rRNA (cytidine1402-2'-O)-methyltransferase